MAASAPSKPHAIAIPLPAQGHINPLMRFCKTLASHGFIITFVNVDPIHHRILECQTRQQPTVAEKNLMIQDTKPRLDIRRAHIPIAGLDMASEFRISFEDFSKATEGLSGDLEDLVERLMKEGPPVTCLISDVFISSATQKVADKFNIPRIGLFSSSCSLSLFDFYLFSGHISVKDAVDALRERNSRADLFQDGLPGLPPLRIGDLPDFKHVVDDNGYMYPFAVRQVRIACEKAHALAVNSFEDLERPAFEALRQHSNLPVYGVGPLVEELADESSTSLWKEDDTCLQWLERQPPQSVLYISFGSLTLLSKLQFEEVLCGLEASKVRFLWAFRPDLVEDAAHSSIPDDFLARTKDRGHVVAWAPQVRVLSHPSVGGFLTHCGWNSMMEGVASGVPMLCWPYFADQFMDAKYVVEEWKAGLRFEAGQGELVARGEVERVVKALMDDISHQGKALRKNALDLRESGLTSLQVGGSSHTSIQAIVTRFGHLPT